MTLRCSCGSPDWMSVAPGFNAEYEPGRGLLDQRGNHPAPVIVKPATPDVMLCLPCWSAAFRVTT